jgi:hypothetical protein
MPRDRRAGGRRRAWLALVIALLALPVAGAAAVVPAARALESGVTADLGRAQTDLRRGAALLEQGYERQDPARVRDASASFARSRAGLEALRRRLAPLDAGRAPAAPGPARSRLVTLHAVVDMAVHLDQAGERAARALLDSGLAGGPAAAAPPATPALTGLLGAVRDELAAAERSAAAIDLSLVPDGQRAALRAAMEDVRAAGDGLDALWPSLGAVLDLVGLDGPRTYLVEQVNPAELRAGGGFIGTVSLVHADRGRVTLARSLPVEAFDYCDAAGCVHPRPSPWQPGYVAPPAELAGPPLPSYSRLTAWSLEDSGFFPDFASNAATAEAFARRLLDTPIDGVIAVDYHAVAPLLELTGPIELPEHHLTLTAANFVDTIVGLDLARDYAHKDVIAAAAARIVAGLSRLPAAGLRRLVRIVQDMVRGRHLQLHFDAPAVQRETARLGATETLNPRGAADFLLETEDNYGGSKANHFLQRRFRLDLEVAGPLLRHRLTIDLHDGAPADQQAIGPHYFAYLRVTVPANATDLMMSSAPSAEYAPIEAPARATQVPPPGARVLGGWIFVPVGEGLSGSYQATFAWDTPWQPAADGSAVLAWQKQPGTVRDLLQVSWTSAGGTASATGDLGEDRVLTLRPGSVTVGPVPHA